MHWNDIYALFHLIINRKPLHKTMDNIYDLHTFIYNFLYIVILILLCCYAILTIHTGVEGLIALQQFYWIRILNNFLLE